MERDSATKLLGEQGAAEYLRDKNKAVDYRADPESDITAFRALPKHRLEATQAETLYSQEGHDADACASICLSVSGCESFGSRAASGDGDPMCVVYTLKPRSDLSRFRQDDAWTVYVKASPLDQFDAFIAQAVDNSGAPGVLEASLSSCALLALASTTSKYFSYDPQSKRCKIGTKLLADTPRAATEFVYKRRDTVWAPDDSDTPFRDGDVYLWDKRVVVVMDGSPGTVCSDVVEGIFADDTVKDAFAEVACRSVGTYASDGGCGRGLGTA